MAALRFGALAAKALASSPDGLSLVVFPRNIKLFLFSPVRSASPLRTCSPSWMLASSCSLFM